MNGLRFNHVYGLILLFCFAIAFVLPHFVDPEPARAQIQNIYAPVSRPSMAIVQWIHARFDRQRMADPVSPERPRFDSDVRQENLELRQEIALLSTQLQKMQGSQVARSKLGRLGNFCTTYSVSAGDAGTGESLLIGGTNLGGLKYHMPVVYPGGLAGWLLTPGLTGTRIRLITDRQFRLTGIFVRGPQMVRIATDPVLVNGEGNNGLLIDSLPLATAQDIHVNDWVLLDDSDWPAALQGEPIGRVVSIPTVSRRSPGFAEIRLEPAVHLMQLRELMVVDRAQ